MRGFSAEAIVSDKTKILDAWKVFQRAEKALVEASAGGTRGKALAKEITDLSEAREALLSLLEPGKVYEVADRVGIAATTESGLLLADLELVDVRRSRSRSSRSSGSRPRTAGSACLPPRGFPGSP